MSGTSLDGLDLAYCSFVKGKAWKFEIQKATTIPYDQSWRKRLIEAPSLTGNELAVLDAEYGRYIGIACRDFVRRLRLPAADILASHGHTIFHQTDRLLTYQLGNGNSIHAAAGVPVVFDFRSLDVALGGQGAPLVPIGDRLLFGNYDVCLNLGGIANLSLERSGQRIAFDICFVNMALNFLSAKIGMAYDANGNMAAHGHVNDHLLQALTEAYNQYASDRPALGREDFELEFQQLLENEGIPVNDRLRTVSLSIAREIAGSLPSIKRKGKMLVTGGGAHNSFLLENIRQQLPSMEIVVPDKTIIDFKEALVFGLLGALRLRGETNVLRSVTRASRDSCSGVCVGIY